MVIRRLADIGISLLALISLLPVFAGVSAAIALTSSGPVLHRAMRVGQGGRLFTLYKFRTMVANAESLGPGITAADDNRITPIGRLLRRTKLDEFPQLINVLRGDMSLVGPRPEDPRYVALYTPEQQKVLAEKPGITSPASIRYRHEEAMLADDQWEERYIAEIMPAKLALDLEYLATRTSWTDIRVIWQTFLVLWK
nr:sugar transferase [Anaerolineae bacterium]